MIEILVYLFENYGSFSARPKARTLRRRLSAVGFQDQSITAALRWLDGLTAAPPVDLPERPQALRVYLAAEQRKLGRDCLGFIAFLEGAGLLAPSVREWVIEGAMLVEDDPVPLAKFKIIVLMVLWSGEQTLEPLVVEELLDDGQQRLRH
ncbi:MAG: hypothetical protein AW12_01867 [Candidatus Accumulibacter sp. BA-94]|uniref:DUF494 family protein n=1 Tax=Accumulibacter sp. TaxID=2053492 RepID=UPI000450A570|nr:DUF494 domain-containing protein [Accumulibacter sp.]EXI88404.1 MAG: hypothetical protein AW12_01867 [Candidatus Accumulibacter sp. BA-94]HRD88700.1 DUF494 domain-containing protein [Accumulibacter sp.]